MERVGEGDVLVTDMTDPDWEPIMKRAAAIVTNRGGRTCHAAIIARELGIPAVVGCGDATRTLADGSSVTVSCADGDTGHVYEGLLEIEVTDVALDRMPPAPTKIMMNVGNPELAFAFSRLPNEGRRAWRAWSSSSPAMSACIRRRCSNSTSQPAAAQGARSRPRIAGYPGPVEFYVSKIAEGVATIAAAFWPKKVIVRLSDFKSNEYSNLLGGDSLRAARREPDARLSRRFALRRAGVLRLLRSSSVARSRAFATTWGSPTSRS